jgi:MFS family permease
MSGAVASRSYRVLRHRDFRLLWFAEALSFAGSQVQKVAVTWQVYELTGDAFKLGLLGLCRFMPTILFGLAGGVLADRGDRRRTLIGAQIFLLSMSLLLALLTATDSITLLAIYLITICSATVEGISNPTRQALIPALVPRADLPAASTMGVLATHVSLICGPALGGVIIALSGITAAYVVDACSFGAVIAAVFLMQARPPRIPVTMSGFAAAIEGLYFLRNTPVLLGLMIVDFVATFFGVSTVLMPIFAEEVLDVGPEGLGLLLAAPAAGGVAMVALLSWFRLPGRAGLTILASIAIYGICLLGFGLSETFWLSLLLLAGSGAADSLSMTLRHATRNLLTPDALRGRVAAVHRALGLGGPQLGEFESGIAASLIGAGPAVVLGGAATTLVALVVMAKFPAILAYRMFSPAPATPSGLPPEGAPAKN